MNIAICEDNIYMQTKLEEIVSSCFSDDTNLFECEVFPSGEALLQYEEQNKIQFQIYLLDIEMAKLTGMETAKKIRQKDKNAIIIFITSHGELMQEAFEVFAFHFLVKPIDETKAKQVLLRAIETLQLKQSVFQFTIRKKIHTLNLQQIEYFESFQRKMIIHTVDSETFTYYGTLKDVLDKIPTQLFAQVHSSYIVNMEQIKTVSGEEIILNSDTGVLLTKTYHKAFNETYRNFALSRMR